MGAKQIIALAGLPGSGKSTLAESLSAELRYVIVSRDSIKRALFGRWDVGIPQNHLAFDVMLQAIPLTIKLAPGIILDGLPFAREGQIERVEDLATSIRVGLSTLFLDCDVVTASQRLCVLDPLAPSDRTPELVARVAATFRPVPANWLHLDGTLGRREMTREAVRILQTTREVNR